MDQDAMRRRVVAAPVGRLATVGADGAPHVVPICFALVGDVAYSAVDQKPKRGARLQRLANIEASGLASLIVDEYHEDWSTLWWVRLDGWARVVDDAAESGEAIGALVAKYRQYEQRPPAGPVLAVDIGWSGCRDVSTPARQDSKSAGPCGSSRRITTSANWTAIRSAS